MAGAWIRQSNRFFFLTLSTVFIRMIPFPLPVTGTHNSETRQDKAAKILFSTVRTYEVRAAVVESCAPRAPCPCLVLRHCVSLTVIKMLIFVEIRQVSAKSWGILRPLTVPAACWRMSRKHPQTEQSYYLRGSLPTKTCLPSNSSQNIEKKESSKLFTS